MILFGKDPFDRVLRAFVEHYNAERPHQGIGNELIRGHPSRGTGEVIARERLGGLLKHYHRLVA